MITKYWLDLHINLKLTNNNEPTIECSVCLKHEIVFKEFSWYFASSAYQSQAANLGKE